MRIVNKPNQPMLLARGGYPYLLLVLKKAPYIKSRIVAQHKKISGRIANKSCINISGSNFAQTHNPVRKDVNPYCSKA